jgi:hypothetical protein
MSIKLKSRTVITRIGRVSDRFGRAPARETLNVQVPGTSGEFLERLASKIESSVSWNVVPRKLFGKNPTQRRLVGTKLSLAYIRGLPS